MTRLPPVAQLLRQAGHQSQVQRKQVLGLKGHKNPLKEAMKVHSRQCNAEPKQQFSSLISSMAHTAEEGRHHRAEQEKYQRDESEVSCFGSNQQVKIVNIGAKAS